MTDEQLEIIESSVSDANQVQGVLIEIEDYLDQIALMATIVSQDTYNHDYPGSDELQVRMIRRLAEHGSKILKPAVEKLDLALLGTIGTVFNIKLDRMREQREKAEQEATAEEKTAQCQHCTDQYINLLQVIDEVVTA